MLFNSIEFVIFIPILFVLYWFVPYKNLRIQNFLIVAASYFFYGWWDWRFLGLIFLSTVVDFWIAQKLKDERQICRRKVFLWISIFVNIGALCFFKYFNFFIDSFVQAFILGSPVKTSTLNIILPVGISFYTFQTLSYTIDVYRKKIEPTNDFIVFAAFVSFFPQLVAGPIERARNLLPQFNKNRYFDYGQASDGMRQILWGLVKKMVIADNCSIIVDLVFNNPENYNGSALLIAVFFFAFQVYGDFSGYSDIAIGTAKLFGFNLMQNFNFPFFSRDIPELWRRWHISLTTWFKDYLYIPLGGSKNGTGSKLRNIIIVFTVSGFWHGASWNHIIWGLVSGLLIIPFVIQKTDAKNLDIVAKDKMLPNLYEIYSMSRTFLLFTLSLIILRTHNLSDTRLYFSKVFSSSFFTIPNLPNRTDSIETFILVAIFFTAEWFGRTSKFTIQKLGDNRAIRWIIYLICIIVIFYFGSFEEISFYYFQF